MICGRSLRFLYAVKTVRSDFEGFTVRRLKITSASSERQKRS